jgi:hypothetical protein
MSPRQALCGRMNVIWLEPWVAIADLDWEAEKARDYCIAWEEQLKREVGPHHALFGKAASLLARRFDTDDALFQLEGPEVEEVHLTWSRRMETDPKSPQAAICRSLEVWGTERMAALIREWTLDQ